MSKVIGLRTLFTAAVAAVWPALVAHATVYKSIPCENATIDNATWNITQTIGGVNTVYVSEHGLGEPTKPAFSTGFYRGANCLAIAMNAHPVEVAPDGNRRDRNEYVLMNESETNTLRFNNLPRYTGFAYMKHTTSVTPNPDNTIIYQVWQGSPHSPIIYFTEDPDGMLRLYVRNDSVGGNALVTPSILLWEEDIANNEWNTFVIYQRLGYSGNGQIALWWNGTKVVDTVMSLGYKPQSAGGMTGALDSCRVKFGMYQGRPNTFHKYFFDEIKFTNVYTEAVP